jgi:hypothetical protein
MLALPFPLSLFFASFRVGQVEHARLEKVGLGRLDELDLAVADRRGWEQRQDKVASKG